MKLKKAKKGDFQTKHEPVCDKLGCKFYSNKWAKIQSTEKKAMHRIIFSDPAIVSPSSNASTWCLFCKYFKGMDNYWVEE